MVNRTVLGELIAELGVVNRLIGRDVTFAGDVGADDWRHILILGAFDMERASRAASLNQGQNGVLAPRALANFVSLHKLSLVSAGERHRAAIFHFVKVYAAGWVLNHFAHDWFPAGALVGCYVECSRVENRIGRD
jgi:hypothetical protein